jgi:hypothetical protein
LLRLVQASAALAQSVAQFRFAGRGVRHWSGIPGIPLTALPLNPMVQGGGSCTA